MRDVRHLANRSALVVYHGLLVVDLTEIYRYSPCVTLREDVKISSTKDISDHFNWNLKFNYLRDPLVGA